LIQPNGREPLRHSRTPSFTGTESFCIGCDSSIMEDRMAPRAYWRGSLKLSLVTCPIALFPASSQAEKTHFHQINTKTGHRLKQQMVDEQTGRVVDKEHKGRGYEVSKGRYVEIDEEELEAVKLESTHTIEIDDFVPAEDIDERYLDKPYYIAPNGKAGADAFVVIRDAMKRKDKVALARVVLSNREHVIALKPLGKGLLGTTLRYPYEVRDEGDYFDDIPSPRVSKDMVDLAAHILNTKASKFDPHKFKDKYENALKALVKRKASGKTIEAPGEKEEESNVIDLMDALKQSLGRKHAAKSTKVKKRAPAHLGRRRRAA
jgi:Ku protein